MGAHLTFADYSEPDWGAIELCEDAQAYRTFWSAVLQYATADNGSAVYFQPDAGENCLTIEVSGDVYSMTPPPKEYHQSLIRAAKRLASSSWLGRIASSVRPRRQIGSLTLEAPGGTVIWHVYNQGSGLKMARLA